MRGHRRHSKTGSTGSCYLNGASIDADSATADRSCDLHRWVAIGSLGIRVPSSACPAEVVDSDSFDGGMISDSDCRSLDLAHRAEV